MPGRARGRRIGWMWTAAACVALLGSALSALQTSVSADGTPAPPPPQADPKKDADLPPEIAKLPFEIKDGYRRFTKDCSSCHDRKRVDEAKHTLFEWQGTIGNMGFKKDAHIPMEDRHPIFLYLAYLNAL